SPGELLPSSWGTPGNGSQCCCFPSALPKGLSWFPSALSRISLLPQVSETERLCYVGHNFGSQVMRCNSLCRYFVGVLDKSSGQMDVYNAEMFNMQPLLSGEGAGSHKDTYRRLNKMDLCIEAFGTSKQKRALSSRRMNAVGSDIVSTAVTKAAANVIDAKGVTGEGAVPRADDVQNISAFLPPCHEDAQRPEHVYRFEDSIFSVHWGFSPHGAIFCCAGGQLSPCPSQARSWD
uniref:RNA polymerase I subunit E n=1 Tax=Zonotrichia albicollis TaxID=44394 RepID=A0A8D2MNZ2_ZONAL